MKPLKRRVRFKLKPVLDMSVSSDSATTAELKKFLSSKGVDEILAELSEKNKTYSELEDVVDVSPATLSKRLQNGAALGIFEVDVTHQRTLDGDVIKKERYTISEEHSDIAESIDEMDLLEILRKKRTFESQANELYAEFIDSKFENSD